MSAGCAVQQYLVEVLGLSEVLVKPLVGGEEQINETNPSHAAVIESLASKNYAVHGVEPLIILQVQEEPVHGEFELLQKMMEAIQVDSFVMSWGGDFFEPSELNKKNPIAGLSFGSGTPSFSNLTWFETESLISLMKGDEESIKKQKLRVWQQLKKLKMFIQESLA